MSINPVDRFQGKVAQLLIRNQNVFDILTKCQLSCGKICRSTVKASTGCGCVSMDAPKTEIDFEKNTYSKLHEKSGISGELCHNCKSSIEGEIGETLFYLASLCNALGISMDKIMAAELKRVEALGKYNLR